MGHDCRQRLLAAAAKANCARTQDDHHQHKHYHYGASGQIGVYLYFFSYTLRFPLFETFSVFDLLAIYFVIVVFD